MNAVGRGAMIGAGVVAGAAIGYGQARGVAARSADTPLYVGSQVGALAIGAGVGGGAVVFGGLLNFLSATASDRAGMAGGAAIALGGVALLAGTIGGMVAEHRAR